MQILLGVVLGVIVFFFSFMFWAIGKKNRLLHEKMTDREFLTAFLMFEHNRQHFSKRTAHFSPIGPGYALNLKIAVQSTLAADNRIRVIGVLGIIGSIGASYFLGSLYAIVNLGLFFVAALLPIGEPGVRNTLRSILEAALILYKWNETAPEECADFIREATSLQKLNEAVKALG
jgi:hypothetical protein